MRRWRAASRLRLSGYQHAAVLQRGDPVTEEEALAALEEHADEKTLAIETLRQPLVGLLAASFPPVTATAVWLREMGLDITLMRFQVFGPTPKPSSRSALPPPVPTVEELTVVPRSKVAAQREYLTAPLDASEFHTLASVLRNGGMRGALDLSASRPGDWVTYTEVCGMEGRAEIRADGGALTRLVRKTFGKNNWPFESQAGHPTETTGASRLDAERAGGEYAAVSDEATTPPEPPPLDHGATPRWKDLSTERAAGWDAFTYRWNHYG